MALKNTVKQEDGEDDEFLLTNDMVKLAEELLRGKQQPPVVVEKSRGNIHLKGLTKAWKQAQLSVEEDELIKFPQTEQVIPTDTDKVASVSVALLEKIVRTAKAAGVEYTIEKVTGPSTSSSSKTARSCPTTCVTSGPRRRWRS